MNKLLKNLSIFIIINTVTLKADALLNQNPLFSKNSYIENLLPQQNPKQNPTNEQSTNEQSTNVKLTAEEAKALRLFILNRIHLESIDLPQSSNQINDYLKEQTNKESDVYNTLLRTYHDIENSRKKILGINAPEISSYIFYSDKISFKDILPFIKISKKNIGSEDLAEFLNMVFEEKSKKEKIEQKNENIIRYSIGAAGAFTGIILMRIVNRLFSK